MIIERKLQGRFNRLIVGRLLVVMLFARNFFFKQTV
jgi:hypothetical protein